LPTDWKEESLQKNEKHFCRNLCELSTENSLKRNLRNKFQQKPLPKKYWQKQFYHKPPEEKSPQSNSQKKPRQKEYLMKKSTKKKSTNKYVNIKFNPNMPEEKFARKKDSRNFGGKSSPIYP